MKNIHILPTNKPSRLVRNHTNKLLLTIQYLPLDKEIYCFPQNIYITSDEEIKNCYYFNSRDNAVRKNNNLNHPYHHKIILTTDQDLIKDGVQAIDDDFLEWFVKNPSCEEVEVSKFCRNGDDCPSLDIYNKQGLCNIGYKIVIIPKEEIKLQCKDCNDNLTDCTCIEDTIDMKQENTADYIDRHIVQAMVEVAKQNLYSEEDMREAIMFGANGMYGWQMGEEGYTDNQIKRFLKTFKNK